MAIILLIVGTLLIFINFANASRSLNRNIRNELSDDTSEMLLELDKKFSRLTKEAINILVGMFAIIIGLFLLATTFNFQFCP